MTVESAAPPEPASASATRYRTYILIVLTAVYTFNFVDRQIIAILSPAIKEDLGLSDTSLGLLKGFYFALFYTIIGLPIAWLADRTNRVNIISISLALWSGFTALSAFAANFVQLSIARVGVGIGEAGGSPPSHALISDYFPKEERARALSVYSLGIPVGQAIAFLAGGWVLQHVGWRAAFLIVGLPGVLLAILLKLTVREPVRGAQDGGFAPPVPLKAGLREIIHIPSYWGVIAGLTLASFAGYGIGAWVVDFYRRTFELSYVEITLPLGLLTLVFYSFGTWLGGWLTDRYGARSKAAYGIIPAISLAALAPVSLMVLFSASPFWAFAWTAPMQVLLGIYLGPSFALIQTLTPVRLRAFSTAFAFFILNLIALGGGPSWVGWLSDQFAPRYGETLSLKIALATLAVMTLLGAAAYAWTSRRLPKDWAAMEARTEAP